MQSKLIVTPFPHAGQVVSRRLIGVLRILHAENLFVMTGGESLVDRMVAPSVSRDIVIGDVPFGVADRHFNARLHDVPNLSQRDMTCGVGLRGERYEFIVRQVHREKAGSRLQSVSRPERFPVQVIEKMIARDPATRCDVLYLFLVGKTWRCCTLVGASEDFESRMINPARRYESPQQVAKFALTAVGRAAQLRFSLSRECVAYLHAYRPDVEALDAGFVRRGLTRMLKRRLDLRVLVHLLDQVGLLRQVFPTFSALRGVNDRVCSEAAKRLAALPADAHWLELWGAVVSVLSSTDQKALIRLLDFDAENAERLRDAARRWA